jgi:hypothetical protein
VFASTSIANVSASCARKGKSLNDFGASCHNLMGCCEVLLVQGTCTIEYGWGDAGWTVKHKHCTATNVQPKGSMACADEYQNLFR